MNSSYPTMGGTDNTVTRLFGLSYLAQARCSRSINLPFRFNTVRHAFGKYVQERLFLCLIWAGPLLAIAIAVSVLLVAMA